MVLKIWIHGIKRSDVSKVEGTPDRVRAHQELRDG